MVELGGFEPPTSTMSMLRSNQLSYNSLQTTTDFKNLLSPVHFFRAELL
jgi:hypothetical protein